MKRTSLILTFCFILVFILSFAVSAIDFEDSLTLTQEEAEHFELSDDSIKNFGTKDSLQFKIYMASVIDYIQSFSQGGTINEKLNRLESLVISNAVISFNENNEAWCYYRYKKNTGEFYSDPYGLYRWNGMYQYIFDNIELSKLIEKDISILKVYCFEMGVPTEGYHTDESFIYYVTDSGDYVLYVSGAFSKTPPPYYYIRWFTAEEFSGITKRMLDDIDEVGSNYKNNSVPSFLLYNDKSLYNKSLIATNSPTEDPIPTLSLEPTTDPTHTQMPATNLTPTPETTPEPTTTEPQSPVLWIIAGGVVVVAIAGGALYFLGKKKKQGA